MEVEACFVCRKHQGLEAPPPGGYIYTDEHWMVCHAPADQAPLGTLFLESRRHFLDFSQMDPEEAASLGQVLQRIYHELKEATRAERIYQLSTMEGVPHFHAWLVPRRQTDAERGLKFLGRDDRCEEREAIELATRLRERLKRDVKG